MTNKRVRAQQSVTYTTLMVWFFALLAINFSVPLVAQAETPLADRPVYSGSVNGNVALALSVEWPTGNTASYKSVSYQKNQTFLGYFDSEKCYAYTSSSTSLNLGLYSTGVDDDGDLLASNRDDSHWTLISSPSGTSNYKKNRLNNTDASYATSTARHIGWAAGSVPAGQYEYRSNNFSIPASTDPNDVSMTFEVLPDDQLVAVKVNGVSKSFSLSNTPSWNNPATVTLPAGTFSTYVNQLTIVINNTGGPAGLRIDQIQAVDEGSNDYGDYFTPVAQSSSHSCQSVSNGRWSGNFLNWSLTQVIDPFRHALTGGTRDVDENAKTILKKAYATGEGGTSRAPDRVINSNATIKQSTPFDSWNYLKLRIQGLGTSFYITGSSGVDISSPGSVTDGASMGSNPSASQTYAFKGRVESCVSGLLEDNCLAYPSGHYKPIGLIQQNAQKLRFGAFGYLNDSDTKRDGGVLRARMSSIGTGGDFPEWEESTGIFIQNPNPADASASGVSSSGVINYLNNFGYHAPGYKSKDPVGELYYTVGRYFRNKGDVAEYSVLNGSSSDNEKYKDGFPVITNWADPIRYSCEANFIIGIGDTNTHADSNLPGSTIASSNEPAMPAAVSSDYGSVTDLVNHYTDVYTSTKRVGDMEGISNLQTTHPSWCCSKNSYFMAGVAYDLHTRDFRPDLSGKQTISTYWLDVLESGFQNQNQFWLAAKYGGFSVEDGYDPYSATVASLDQNDWDVDKDGDPDHYFRADNPAAMEDSLTHAFDSILSEIDKVSVGFALSSPNISSGDKSFGATYKSGVWTGELSANNITFDGSGNPIETEVWTSDNTFATQVSGSGWDNNRRIITANCSATGSNGAKNCTAVPFRHGSLNSDNLNALDQVDIYTGVSQEVLNYLRGDTSNEGKYRSRSKILGDIVNSKVAPVGPPNAPYTDTYNPGYSSFKSTYQNRTITAYVGANDGMLHAFNANTGLETFAYVPQALYQGPDNYPQSSGLAALAYNHYLHRFYVDASPAFYDVNFGTSDWHTILLGGLGKGGKSYFALDITNPDAISSETAAANKFLWEFSHDDLGFTFGRPISVKVDGKWVVIFTSGYNNQDGKGYFFVVDPKTGALINKVSTGVGSTTNDAGLAHLTAFIPDGADFTADAAYAGDLLGNVWRLDLSGIATAGYSKTPQLIATLTSPNGQAQPITTSPVVEYDQSTKERIVFIGTGRLLDATDLPVTQVHSIYAIKDGDKSAFYTSGTLPSGVSGFPVTRALMVDHTNQTGAVTADSAKPMGYYIDMTAGFYIDRPMVSSAGAVGVLSNQIIGDSCDVDSIFRAYVFNYASGESLITNTNTGITTQYVEGNGLGNSISIYQNVATGKLNVNISHDDDEGGNTSVELGGTAAQFKTLNWRLVPIE